MVSLPKFEHAHLEGVCNVLGDTNDGLTGTEIGKLLKRCGIQDVQQGGSKRVRLLEALWGRQAQDECGNHVARFIEEAMNPARHRGKIEWFEAIREDLNEALAFCCLLVETDGKLRKREAAATLPQAESRARNLRRKLAERGVHGDVLKACQAEFLQDNYFHAVFEATKSLAKKIREKSGVDEDGAKLVDLVFGFPDPRLPVLAFNSLCTQVEKGEQRGLMTLLKGIFGTFRNVTAHAPKITWPIDEQDALDLLSMASLLHRRLDMAARTGANIGDGGCS